MKRMLYEDLLKLFEEKMKRRKEKQLEQKIASLREEGEKLGVHWKGEVENLEERERKYIEFIYHLTGENKTQAIAHLGISRQTIYEKLQEYQDVDKPGKR